MHMQLRLEALAHRLPHAVPLLCRCLFKPKGCVWLLSDPSNQVSSAILTLLTGDVSVLTSPSLTLVTSSHSCAAASTGTPPLQLSHLLLPVTNILQYCSCHCQYPCSWCVMPSAALRHTGEAALAQATSLPKSCRCCGLGCQSFVLVRRYGPYIMPQFPSPGKLLCSLVSHGCETWQ